MKFLLIFLCIFATSCVKPKYYGSVERSRMMYSLEDIGNALGQVYDMRLIGVGSVVDDPYKTYGLLFTSKNLMTLDVAKRTCPKILESFYAQLQQNPWVKEYETYSTQKFHFEHTKVCLQNSCLRIDFWDNDVNRPLPPSLSQICFVDNTFYFYDADPQTQELRLVASIKDTVVAEQNQVSAH